MFCIFLFFRNRHVSRGPVLVKQASKGQRTGAPWTPTLRQRQIFSSAHFNWILSLRPTKHPHCSLVLHCPLYVWSLEAYSLISRNSITLSVPSFQKWSTLLNCFFLPRVWGAGHFITRSLEQTLPLPLNLTNIFTKTDNFWEWLWIAAQRTDVQTTPTHDAKSFQFNSRSLVLVELQLGFVWHSYNISK